MGFEITRFKSSLSSVVICSICSNVLKNPLQSYHCKHTFCKKCIKISLQTKNECPKCLKPLTRNDLEVPSTIVNYLSNLEIKCEFASNGCYVFIKLDSLKKHLEECQFNPENNATCPQNCGAVMKRCEIDKHCCLSYLQSVITERDSFIEELIKDQKELKKENKYLKMTKEKLLEEIEKKKDEIKRLKSELESREKGIPPMLKFDLLYSQSKAVSEEHRIYIKELKSKGLIVSNKIYEVMQLVDINNFVHKECNTKKA